MNGPMVSEELGNCWVWKGSRTRNGYGQIFVRRNPATGKRLVRGAHIIAMELDGQYVEKGMEPDHMCRNRLCVRVSHLELITHKENAQRRTPPKCKRGHPYEGNYVLNGGGNRTCKTCKYEREQRLIKKAAARIRHDRALRAALAAPTPQATGVLH